MCPKQSNHNYAKSTKITKKKINTKQLHVGGETQYKNNNSNKNNHAMATVRTSEQAKANEKAFCCCCCLYATHTLYAEAPSPFDTQHWQQEPTEG